jgi:hypothetical protein
MAISPQAPDFSLTMQAKNALTVELLRDQGSRISAQYGLKFETAQTHQKMPAQFDVPLSMVNCSSERVEFRSVDSNSVYSSWVTPFPISYSPWSFRIPKALPAHWPVKLSGR